MKEKHLSEITEMLDGLTENQLLYLLTFIKQMFN